MSRQSHTDTTHRREIAPIQYKQKQSSSLTTTNSPDTKQHITNAHIRQLHLRTRREGQLTLRIRKDLPLTGVAAVHLLHQEPGARPR